MSSREKDRLIADQHAEGMNAYVAGVDVKNCPYGRYTTQAERWRRGWGNAQMGAILNKSEK